MPGGGEHRERSLFHRYPRSVIDPSPFLFGKTKGPVRGMPLSNALAGGGSWIVFGPVLLSGRTARVPRIQSHRRPVISEDRAPVNSSRRIAAAAC